MRERFFNNHKLIPHRLDYKFFVPVLALVMIVSSALPTMSANAQPASSISSDITSLEQCIEKFQGSDTTYCGSSYPLQVAKSGQIFSKYRYGSSNSIIVNEQTKVTLSGLRSSDPDSDKLSYSWSQIGGDTITFSSTTTPVISFFAPAVPPNQVKTVTIGLTVDDGHGGVDIAKYNIIVLHVNHPPIVQVGPDQTVDEGAPVTITGSATDPDNDPLKYAWGQYSGIDVELSSYGDTSVSFTAPAVDPGSTKALLFIFTADDGHGGRASALVKVTVKSTHISPTVSCPDISVQENTPVTLAATISNPSGDQLSYKWKQISGIPVQLSSSTDLTPTFVAPTPNGIVGELKFELSIGDELISIPSCDVIVKVTTTQATGQPPVADAGPDQTVDELTRVVLDGSASKGDHIKYSWEQVGGDKVTLLFRNTASPALFAPAVPIGETKELDFKLTVTNEFGSDSANVKIIVEHNNENPTAVITPE